MVDTDWKCAQVTKCHKCGSHNVKYRLEEDDECHVDANYKCEACGASWWVDGIDS